MLTEEQINAIQEKILTPDPVEWMQRFARAIESAVRAEYADVPPEKFKALYRALKWLDDDAMQNGSCCVPQDGYLALATSLNAIDNGTYNPKIGGE